jgi:hypothetical protein
VATRQRLDAGYQRVVWMDADVFVFDPAKLVLDYSAESLTTGYAFGREVWLSRDTTGVNHVTPPRAHNAATFFTQDAVDLDMLITLIRHIDARRQIVSNFQVGVDLLRGLQYSLMFPTFSHVPCSRRYCSARLRNMMRRSYSCTDEPIGINPVPGISVFHSSTK